MDVKNLSDSEFDEYFSKIKDTKKSKKKGVNKKRRRIIISAGVILALAFIIYILSGLPSLEELENPKPQLASKVFTADGELLGQFYIENRIETDIDSIPPVLVDALISTEDKKFYDHWGVDFDRFFKAMFKNIITLSNRGGASTITQQLAKNLYKLKSKNESSFEVMVRKIREWISAIQIEKNFTKREILELYLNVSYFGRSAYGVESAAKIFFDKKAKNLNTQESALLVALLKSSVVYDPIKNPQNAMNRRNTVMLNMVQDGKLSREMYDKLKDEPITLTKEKLGKFKSIAPHFMEYVRQQMEANADKYGYNLYRDGLNIYTSIDMRMQKIANRVAAEHLKEYQAVFNKNWKWENNQALLNSLVDKTIHGSDEYRSAGSEAERNRIYNKLKNNPAFIDSVKRTEAKIQIGFVVMDPHTGQIKAMVGGENQEFLYGLNHVTQIRRQPGSSFKPFVYITAINNGYYPAYSVLNQKFDYNGWSPSNSDGTYSGYMTLREALANSVNVVAGRLVISDMAPISQVLKVAKKMGINSKLNSYPSLALGAAEVTPLEIVNAYGTIANKGVYVSPVSITKIEDRNGMTIDQFMPEYSVAISEQTAAIITSMMQDVVTYGTGAGVKRYFYRPAAGKTGTTSEFADAWFIGFTPQLVAGVWVGFDDHRIKFNGWYGQGARAALPVWAKFMADAYKELNIPLQYFQMPGGITTAEFCRESILAGETRLATENCPDKVSDIINEGNMPEYCNIHGHGGKSAPPKETEKKGDSGW
jgi:penicillin-binding protein 1A